MAFGNAKQIEELADKLTKCADSIHGRLMKAIKKKEIDRYRAQSISQDVAMLRQYANSLYIDAAHCVVDGLRESQKSIMGVIDTAEANIRSMKNIERFIDLVADMLVFAAAAYAAKPVPILAALGELRKDIEDMGRKRR